MLESMGQKPSGFSTSLPRMVDEDRSQTIDFPKFLTVIQCQLTEAERAKVRVDSREYC